MEDQLIPRVPYSALAVLLVAFVGCALRQDGAPADTRRLSDATIRDILAHRVDAKQSAGLVVGIGQRDTSRFVAYGTFNGPDTPSINEDTVFEIGSVTKVFTATVLADMVTRGEVALQEAARRRNHHSSGR